MWKIWQSKAIVNLKIGNLGLEMLSLKIRLTIVEGEK